MISASLIAAHTYEVVVEGAVETRHTVRMSPDLYRRLCGATVTHEWVLIQAFKLLRERAPDTAIVADFDLSTVDRDLPGFDAELQRRLGR